MNKQIEMKNLLNTTKVYMTFKEEDTCPICKYKIAPVYLASTLCSDSNASVYNYCKACQNTFISNYSIKENVNYKNNYNAIIISSVPNKFTPKEFDENIVKLSPQFVKIYNQAREAEVSELDEIAGLGYRKALEFLIKDYAIYKNPESEEQIKAKPLSQCIKQYIDYNNIITLAEKSAWIGNDEAHYIRKQEDRDVTDMKKFIDAIVYFINMILITEDATSMEAK